MAVNVVRLEPGRWLDRYQLLARIAAGGMASIWLGRLTGKHGFERLVAIKTMLPELAHAAVFRTMLLDEARIASGIHHANVAEILDVGEEHGILYIVMEWVEGDSLSTMHRALVREHRAMPLPVVLRVCADACRGLHAAHELRNRDGQPLHVVHRDISPQNILVGPDGVAKVIDFGIAKARERLQGSTTGGVGMIKGKARFMAPEQALADAVDRRADIWSMGAVLQYLLTGGAPYAGATDVDILSKIVGAENPDPLPPHIPQAASRVVERALEWRPDDRYATAEELATALDHALVQMWRPTSVGDVSNFVASALPGLAERRKKIIDRALAEVDDEHGSAR
ncbi:MAG TPA: serine/threonine-protein kinase [Polyangiaceae bacterium]|nr:serine/threonine-protein kinase [Polyangiaceae bacterium]